MTESMTGQDQHLFLIYPPRSGSTLLQIMLAQHPQVMLSPEVRFALKVFKRYADPVAPLTGESLDELKHLIQQDDKLLNWKLDTAPYLEWIQAAESLSPHAALEALFRFYRDATAPTARIIGMKKGNLAPRLERVAQSFPDARYLYIYRDGRACVASMVKNLDFADYATAAKRWHGRISAILRFAATHPGQIYGVRYEDLIADPEQVSRGICAFLGIPFDERMLHHHEANRQLQLITRGREKQHQHTGEAISQKYADAWRSQLDPQQIRAIEGLIAKTLTRLGYELTTPPPRPTLLRRIRRRLPGG